MTPRVPRPMFRTLAASGYNTVRVFIIGRNNFNPGIGGDYETTRGLYEPYMENVLDFLRRATRHNIRVFPTFGDGELPNNDYFLSRFGGNNKEKNRFILTAEGRGCPGGIYQFLPVLSTEERTRGAADPAGLAVPERGQSQVQ